MNATKRKFNTLLQGLSSPRPTETPQKKTSDVESLLEKRRRLGIPQSNSTSLISASTSPSSIARSSSTRQAVSSSKVQDSKPQAGFNPTDRAELLKRLATFNDITDWTPKPDRVSEIEWARRGWVCHAKETVRCVLCHKELVVKVNKKEVDGKEVSVLVPSEIESALVDKYAELIVTSHQEDCLWRQRGCDESLLRLSITSPAIVLQTLRERYDELCARKDFLPYEFNLRLPEDFKIDTVLAELPSDFFGNGDKTSAPDNTTQPEPNRVAFTLALFGWQGLTNVRIGAVPNSASCHTCQRRLGLWMFKSKEVGDDGEVIIPAPMDYLDPVREHRFFCPWKNADAQKRASARIRGDQDQEPGWKVLLQTLENEAHLRSLYDNRPRTAKSAHGAVPPVTPSKRPQTAGPTTPGTTGLLDTPGGGSVLGNEEADEKELEAKEKERWARLKRVKSLFDIKGSRRAKSASRPGTSQSTRTTQSTKTNGEAAS